MKILKASHNESPWNIITFSSFSTLILSFFSLTLLWSSYISVVCWTWLYFKHSYSLFFIRYSFFIINIYLIRLCFDFILCFFRAITEIYTEYKQKKKRNEWNEWMKKKLQPVFFFVWLRFNILNEFRKNQRTTIRRLLRVKSRE